MAHSGRTLAASMAYIEMVFGEYRDHAEVERFHGRVAEVGPGDNCGVALLFLADGCETVDLVDRFYSKRDDRQHSSIYRALIASSRRLQELFGDAKTENKFHGVKRHYGERASAECFFVTNCGYDFIVSRAVLEHVRDPLLSLRCMSLALNPGGVMMHVVDLRDHGMFSEVGFPETKFLELPDWIYRPMTNSVGRPNRVPLGAYCRILASCGLEYEIKVTHLVGEEKLASPTRYETIDAETRIRAISKIASIRARLPQSLRDESDENLSVSGFFLIAKKQS